MSSTEPLALGFDLETTGLTLHPHASLAKQPRIIEFGGALLSLRTGEVVEELSLLMYPGEPVSAEITSITGITNDMLRDQPAFPQALGRLREFFCRAEAMFAHNLPFDRDVLRYEVERYSVLAAGHDFPWPAREFCTMNFYTPQWGRPPRLVEIYAAIVGKEYPQTHRALDDVRAMIEVVQKDGLWEVML